MRKPAEEEKRTDSITLRVEKKVLDKLREEANRKMKSVNVLGNQVLKFYVNWHSPAIDAGFVYIDKKNLSRILDKLTETEIDQILDEYFETEFVGRLKMITGRIELNRFLTAMEGWMSGSGLRYRHVTNQDMQSYVIQHDTGKNAAYYMREYYRRALEYMKVKNLEVKSTNDTLWIEFTTE